MIEQKLIEIQNELKVPKQQFNSFGNYKFRSCEDILEAVKPICLKYNTCLTLSDKIQQVGERYYIEATATLYDLDDRTATSVTGYARECETKKQFDESQITGTASSYARKYALAGLFNLDDTKDADTDEVTAVTTGGEKINKTLAKVLIDYVNNNSLDAKKITEIYKKYGYEKTQEICNKDYMKIFSEIKSLKGV